MANSTELLISALGLKSSSSLEVSFEVAELLMRDETLAWATLSILLKRFPSVEECEELLNLASSGRAQEYLLRSIRKWPILASPKIHLLRDAVVVDVDTTARTAVTTGIQRVVREVLKRWHRRNLSLAVWDEKKGFMCFPTREQETNALSGGLAVGTHSARKPTVIVPLNSEIVVLELATEVKRTERLAALARFSNNRLRIVGHDCVPLTSAETTAPGMGGAFLKGLSMAKAATTIASTSASSHEEYSGWARSLSGLGVAGPQIKRVNLPTLSGPPSLDVAKSPSNASISVLCVGSHEPRKNHLRVLYAAEKLWREELQFSLVMVGGNSWSSDYFMILVEEMLAQGRPISVRSAVSDSELFDLYRTSSFSVFPSLNEGFGLPVAESLSHGLPVITSGFGSMKELAQGGGAIVVDPNSTAQLAEAMRSLIVSPLLRDDLRMAASRISHRTWDDYARDLWSAFELDSFNTARGS